MIPNRFSFLIITLISFLSINAQFKIKNLESGFNNLQDSSFLNITLSRKVEDLNSGWKVFFAETPENYSQVNFPISFTSEQTIIFEKKFEISAKQQLKNFTQLTFLGINYSAEIYINNAAVYKHPGGELPFTIDLSDDLLNFNAPNTIRIKIQYHIDAKNTIPLLQRFLFPKSFGGILRDVYLSFRPRVGIKNIEYSLEDDTRFYKGKFNFNVNLENFDHLVSDSTLENYDGRFKIEAQLRKTSDTSNTFFNIWNINPIGKDNFSKKFTVRLKKIYRWSSDSPISYILSAKLTNGDGFVYDELKKEITLLDLKKGNRTLIVNDKKIKIKGVTYLRSLDKVSNYNQIHQDIKTIKENGFNTIRFSKVFPHPYAVYLCKQYGLYALIELPLNSVPERFTEDSNFEDRAKLFLERAISAYEKYPNVIAYGAGGSYLSNSQSHSKFISNLSLLTNSKGKLSYVSMIGNLNDFNGKVDLCGIELYASNPLELKKMLSSQSSSSAIDFISEATYPTFKGETNGYLNTYSFEGQAKFFDDVITVSKDSLLNGFVLNSMFDFKGDYSPFFTGFNKEKVYKIGIFPEDGNKARISSNLLKSRLKSVSKVTVPIGNNNEDAPLFFIIVSLFLSIIIALLINSKRKFREDATRALLRPYNFFADIRDQRILSGFHSNTLMFLLAGSNALLVTIIFYFLRNNILFEKLILSFGNYKFSALVGYLAWNLQEAFAYIYIATIVIFILLSVLIHFSSFFVKTKVLFSSVYSVAIWAFLPFALLLPVELILYKILLLHTYDTIIFLILIFFLVWTLQRLLKGVYVIFDIRPLNVYIYAFLTILFIILAFGMYFQYTVSAFDYISLAIKQYVIL